ncbi:MAG: hypothetical protein QM533_12590 [Cytophagales bacterium]|nr:hypothetical protein [Cytophagales bacterium]
MPPSAQLAAERTIWLVAPGNLVSSLVRKGLAAQSEPAMQRKKGFPVFAVSATAQPIGLAQVRLDVF